MLVRFAIVVTVLELVLTAGASVIVSYVEAPPAFATENDLRDLGLSFTEHRNSREGTIQAPIYDTNTTLSTPTASLWVRYRADMSKTDLEFRRAREEVRRNRPDFGELVIVDEPMPGELGYAVRHRGTSSVRFELVRLRGSELLIVNVVRKMPYESQPSAELARCERRARVVQEHLMTKLRWRE